MCSALRDNHSRYYIQPFSCFSSLLISSPPSLSLSLSLGVNAPCHDAEALEPRVANEAG